ncbi:MAG TPA: hypothetical protein VFH37_03670 [Candidatus Saccharimonadales bacterium]|nr:hypothetical protein [Candidatus Saccharimonadales bacterium]
MRSLRQKHRKSWVFLLVLAALVLAGGGAVAAKGAAHKTSPQIVAVAQMVHGSTSSCASGPGKLCWDGKKGIDACPIGTTGNMLVIFNPHSGAVPTSLVVTWGNNETDTYTSGWINPGGSQDWHITVDIVGKFPPKSFYVTYTGTLGNNPVLTISGCNESSGGTTGTTTTGTTSTTGTTETTTSSTTTVTVSTTTTVPSTTTLTVPTTTTETTTTTVTTPKPPKHHKHHKKPKIPKHPHPTNTE